MIVLKFCRKVRILIISITSWRTGYYISFGESKMYFILNLVSTSLVTLIVNGFVAKPAKIWKLVIVLLEIWAHIFRIIWKQPFLCFSRRSSNFSLVRGKQNVYEWKTRIITKHNIISRANYMYTIHSFSVYIRFTGVEFVGFIIISRPVFWSKLFLFFLTVHWCAHNDRMLYYAARNRKRYPFTFHDFLYLSSLKWYRRISDKQYTLHLK